MPPHSPRSGAAMIGQVEYLIMILEEVMEEVEKLSVAPPVNFTIQQQ
jgi:hypothetical protein